MYSFTHTARFKRSIKRLVNFTGFKKEELAHVLGLLQEGKKLPVSKKDHALQGALLGFRDCHVQNDIVLIYAISEDHNAIELYDIGTHAQLFG